LGTLLFNLENVDVANNDLVVLHQVNLQIESGEKVALVGPSGTGKTSLLHTLYQLRPRECAFIQQHFALVPQLSVVHNIHLKSMDYLSIFLRFFKLVIPQKKRKKKIMTVLKKIGMEEKMFEEVGRLSEDQQQRVAVGRAIYQGKPILLADEPVASMDFSLADAILNILIGTEKTVVMALHSVELTLKYARRIVGLSAGRICFDLPVDQVTPDYITDLYLPG
jgi:phosphonate transport system ATP-binding protein